jgi:HK97 family phage prohead protease
VNFSLYPVVLKRSDVSERGSFAALAASFTGRPDRQGDQLVPGVFRDSLADIESRGARLPLLWQHDASEPIGAITHAEETDRGLEVEGQLALDGVANAKRAHALMRVGGLSLSIMAAVPAGGAELRDDGVRMLKRLDLHEISAVAVPADPGSVIHTVKGLELDYERAVRVYLGLPKRKAELLIQKGLAAMGGADSELDAAKADAAAARIVRLLSPFLT